MSEKMAAVGWQGITLKAPTDWSLVGVSGSDQKGYFRVDGPIAAALEVRWSAALGKSPNLEARANEFVNTLEKANRKTKARFSSKVRPARSYKDGVEFSWQGERTGQGRIFYCAECDRVIVAQLTTTSDEDVSKIATAMLGSIRDHRDDGWVDWALYGLRLAVPRGYRIEKQTLMSGYIALDFRSHGKQLVVERWGLAKTLLQENPLPEWFRKDVVPDIKGYRIEMTQEQVRGHEGLIVKGRRSGIKQMAKAAVRSLTLYPHPGLLTALAWHCSESNRLFTVRATHTAGDDIVERVAGHIECH